MRSPTKAWLVLADENGPITGLELPNITNWEITAHEEPLFWDLVNSFSAKIPGLRDFELEIRLTNSGPYVERVPPPTASDRPRNWKPKSPRGEIAPKPEEIEK